MYTAGLTFHFPVNGHTWLFLINGGEKSFEEEKVARNELKKIHQCFVSNKLVKPEHVVCATGGKGKLFQHETVTNVSKVSSVVFQISEPKVNQPIQPMQLNKQIKKKALNTCGGLNLQTV